MYTALWSLVCNFQTVFQDLDSMTFSRYFDDLVTSGTDVAELYASVNSFDKHSKLRSRESIV